jgi:hypothetical protein
MNDRQAAPKLMLDESTELASRRTGLAIQQTRLAQERT